MKVTIRRRTLRGDDRESLFLEIYANKKRRYKFLNLHPLVSPKTKEDRLKNKDIERKAEAMRIQIENDLLNQRDISLGFKKSNIFFLDYFKQLVDQHRKSAGSYGNWDSAYKVLLQYYGDRKVKISDLTEDDLDSIKHFIETKYKKKSDTTLSRNAAASYFNKVKICLNQAFDEKLIPDKIGARVKSIKGEETGREYLTQEEVVAIEQANCESDVLKNAFLFSVYTGLRWSDINNLLWHHIQYAAERGYSLNFKQQKTKGVEYLPIPDKAMSFVGERQRDNERVFKGLKYSAWHNLKIREWMINAGINRKITFHSARHTYATLLLTKNVDIYTVSKMLGHKNLKTTEIYAKVINQKKIDAAKLLDDLLG